MNLSISPSLFSSSYKSANLQIVISVNIFKKSECSIHFVVVKSAVLLFIVVLCNALFAAECCQYVCSTYVVGLV